MAGGVGLNSDQLFEVTNYRRASKQIEALVSMNIPFRIRPDGTPFVTHEALNPPAKGAARKPSEPVLTLI